MTRPPRICDLCHGDIEKGVRGPLCGECAAWDRYWAGLTAAEREAELASMDDYVNLHAEDRA